MSSKKIVNIIAYIFIAVILIFVFTKGKPVEKPASSEIYSMNTICDLEIYGKDKEAALQKSVSLINTINGIVDDFSPESDVYKINENAGIHPVKVSKTTIDILEKAIQIAKQTNGAFDPTIRPLLVIWGFKNKNYRVPTEEEIKAALKLISYQDIVINKADNTVFLKHKGEGIDLGGIAKGYTLDRIKEALDNFNITSALINMGGNVLTYKNPPNSSVWRIGIKNPRGNGIRGIITVKGTKFISTSGDYERYFIKNGVRYCHIINPKTGKPARKIISITVVSDKGYLGDALSTAFFVKGKEFALQNATRFNVGVVGFDDKMTPFISNNIKELITIYNEAR